MVVSFIHSSTWYLALFFTLLLCCTSMEYDRCAETTGLSSGGPVMEGSWWWLGALATPRTLLLLPIALYAVRTIARLWRMHWLTADIPGPSLPLLWRLWRARRSASRVSEAMQAVLRDNWPIFKFWSGPALFVVIQDARDMEFVLSNKSITHKSFLYRMLAKLQGVGLIHLSYGDEWKRHRRIVSPFLGSEVLKEFVSAFHQKSMVMVRHLEPYARNGETLNIYDHVALVINDGVCHTIMATDMNSQENKEGEFGRALSDGLAIIIYRTLQPWFISNTVFRLSQYYDVFHRNVMTMHSFMQRVLETKRREREERGRGRGQALGGKPSFVDLMLDTPEDASFTDGEILDEAKTLVSAAAGATTDALAFVLLCLSLQQDVQDKVIQELDDIFSGDLARAVTEDDLRHMDYLERVIKESMRMFPSVPVFGRSLTTDIRLPSGHCVPAGAQLFLYTPGAHRDAHHFPEPELFDPDRFLPERRQGRSAFSFLPFSAGPRHCVGQRFAYTQMKTTVATLLRHYRLLPSAHQRHPQAIADIKTNLLVTLRARGGYNLRLQWRPHGQPSAA